MKRFVEGEDRRQATLLPECLDDYVTQDNPVRVIEVFIDELDLGAVGFAGVVPEATGRPAYHPATLLKIYLYGYLNRIQSSRRLERETQRNIELMWLTGRLMPDFKTIADFRRDNGPAIRAACAQFVVLCRQLSLFTRAVVAIDGSKFKAVNTRDKNFTVTKVAKRIEQVEASITRYLAALDRADRQDDDVAEAKTVRLKEKIEGLRRQMQSLKEMGKQVEAAPDKQVSLTDPDARSMATSGKGTGIVGYNVQMAVDTEHHLIVAHEVTNIGSDRAQLTSMGQRARDASVRRDHGAGRPRLLQRRRGAGLRRPRSFALHSQDTDIRQRQARPLHRGRLHLRRRERPLHLSGGQAPDQRKGAFGPPGGNIDHYRNLTACSSCALKPRCTPDKHKRLKRWEHEGVLDKMQDRLDRMPAAMTIRRQTVEHPFGTLKAWMGSTHFLTKTLENVKTEMSLQVLAYNMKRMINIFGVKPLMTAIAA